MIKKKLVIEIRGRPKRYRVIGSEKVLDSLLEEKKREIHSLEGKVKEFKENIATKMLEKDETGENVMRVKDRNDFDRILAQEIEKSQKQVLALTDVSEKQNILKARH